MSLLKFYSHAYAFVWTHMLDVNEETHYKNENCRTHSDGKNAWKLNSEAAVSI
jgi:hypothetical protein